MHKMTLSALSAALALAGCKQETVTAGAIRDDTGNAAAAAAPVELPPAIKSSKAYRCKDNSLVYIDLFDGDLMANVRSAKDAPAVMLKAATAGEPLVAEGYSLAVTEAGVTLEQPGKPSQSCKTG